MTEEFDELIYKYRYVIGGSLIFIILLGLGAIGFYKYQQKQKTSENQQLLQLKQENENLRQELSKTAGGQVAGITVQSQGDKININTASAADLDKLPGVGPARAAEIISYRESHTGFKTIEDLKNIKGIGDKTFESLKDLVTVGN